MTFLYAGVRQYDGIVDADARTATFPVGDGAVAGDVIRVRYPWRRGAAAAPPPPPQFITNSSITIWSSVPDLPAATQDGDLAVCIMADRGAGGPSNLNGYTEDAISAPVTGNTYGNWTVVDARMRIYSKRVSGPTDKPSGMTSSYGGSYPAACWVIVRTATVGAVATATTGSVSAADTPASPTGSPQLLLRAWSGLMSGDIFPPPGRGTLLGNTSWTNQDLAVISDTDPTAATATCATSTQWRTATVVIEGAW